MARARTATVNGRTVRVLPMTRFQLARLKRAGAQMQAKGRAMIAGKPWRTAEPFDLCAFAAKLLPDLSQEEIGHMPVWDIVALLDLSAAPAPPNPRPVS